jgi:hypothetical protein
MAILSISEFEAILMQVVARIEKELVAIGPNPTLEKAHDEFGRILKGARDAAKLKASHKKMSDLADAVTAIISDDKLLNQFWDLLDYVEYRA